MSGTSDGGARSQAARREPTAILSDDGLYRYRLTRPLSSNGEHGKGLIAWIMFNPSVADAFSNDATIRKVMGFSCRWGFDDLEVYNLFAYRSTDSRKLWKVPDPIGPENRSYLENIEPDVPVIAAWGAIYNGGQFDEWITRVKQMLAARRVQCLGRCNGGEPRHPLMLAYRTPLQDLWPSRGPQRS